MVNMFSIGTTSGLMTRYLSHTSSVFSGTSIKSTNGAKSLLYKVCTGMPTSNLKKGAVMLSSRIFDKPQVMYLHSDIPMPDFSPYRRSPETTDMQRKTFTYLVAGVGSTLTIISLKAALETMALTTTPSLAVRALSSIEVDLFNIPEGKNVQILWRGKPLFIRHRTKAEIDEANSVDMKDLIDPQPDSARVQKPEWLVMIGVCTHLGCIPVGESGDYGGWFCPCHGSHYDISGRIRKGPAPLNLEIPPYQFVDNGTRLLVG